MLKVKNKMGETIEICRYKGSPFYNIFVHGGVHDSQFTIPDTIFKELRKQIKQQDANIRMLKWRELEKEKKTTNEVNLVWRRSSIGNVTNLLHTPSRFVRDKHKKKRQNASV